jgi:hypothetical protein
MLRIELAILHEEDYDLNLEALYRGSSGLYGRAGPPPMTGLQGQNQY